MQCKILPSWSLPQFETIMGSKSHCNIYLLHISEPIEIKYTNSTALVLKTDYNTVMSEDIAVPFLYKPAEVYMHQQFT